MRRASAFDGTFMYFPMISGRVSSPVKVVAEDFCHRANATSRLPNTDIAEILLTIRNATVDFIWKFMLCEVHHTVASFQRQSIGAPCSC